MTKVTDVGETVPVGTLTTAPRAGVLVDPPHLGVYGKDPLNVIVIDVVATMPVIRPLLSVDVGSMVPALDVGGEPLALVVSKCPLLSVSAHGPKFPRPLPSPMLPLAVWKKGQSNIAPPIFVGDAVIAATGEPVSVTVTVPLTVDVAAGIVTSENVSPEEPTVIIAVVLRCK